MVMNFLVCIALMRAPGHGKKFFRVIVVYIGSISKGMGVRRLGKCPGKEIPMRGWFLNLREVGLPRSRSGPSWHEALEQGAVIL